MFITVRGDAEKLSRIENSLIEGTKYEVAEIENIGDEITAAIRLTMYSEDGISDELNARLEKELDSLPDIGSFINRDFEILFELYTERIENGQYAGPVEKELHFTYNDTEMYEPVLSEIAGLFYIYGSEEGTQEAEQSES